MALGGGDAGAGSGRMARSQPVKEGLGGEVGLPGWGAAWRWPQEARGVERED